MKGENVNGILDILEDNLEELEHWSVYNEDKGLRKINKIKELVEDLRENLEDES